MKFTRSPTSFEAFWPDSPRGRSRAEPKYVTVGLLKKTSSDLKVSETNRMHSKDLKACRKEEVLLFLVPFRSQSLTIFGLSHFALL